MKKNLLSQAKGFVRLLREHFGKHLVSAVLFGSVGRCEARPDSNIDILLVIDDLPSGRYTRRNSLEPVMDKASKSGLDAVFNCHIKTPDEAKKVTVMYFDFPSDAKLLHDTDSFFRNIIKSVSEKIKRQKSVRKRWGKFYYWDLKPGAHADDVFDIL